MAGTELPEGWAWATLGDLAEYINGRGFKKAEWSTSGRPIIRIQNLTGSSESFNYFPGPLEDKHIVQPGDLLVSWAASLGVYIWSGPEAALNQHIFKVTPFIDKKFLRHLIDYQLKNITGSTHGSGMVHVTRNKFDELPVAIPPLAEQSRIVESLEGHLSHLDATEKTMAESRHRIASLRKSLLAKIIPQPLPPSWEVTTVGEAGSIDLGRQRHPDWHNGPEMHPYLRVANVFEDRIDDSDVMEMDFSGIFNRYKLHPGDILLNEGQSPHLVGRPAMYRGFPKNVAFTNSLLRFRAREDVLPEWALLVFRRHLHTGRFMQEVRITTNIAHLSAKRLKSVEFPIPLLEEQQRLVTVCQEQLRGADAFDAEVSKASIRSQHLRRALLHHAFTGRLVPQDPADEPASVLLARIQEERAAQAKVKPKRARRAPAKRTASAGGPPPAASSAPLPTHAVQPTFDVFQDEPETKPQDADQ
ncbi:restriction endonuclease subunit S [Streptomyces sp. NPDC054796]